MGRAKAAAAESAAKAGAAAKAAAPKFKYDQGKFVPSNKRSVPKLAVQNPSKPKLAVPDSSTPKLAVPAPAPTFKYNQGKFFPPNSKAPNQKNAPAESYIKKMVQKTATKMFK